jgi:segregation and condensation protein B
VNDGGDPRDPASVVELSTAAGADVDRSEPAEEPVRRRRGGVLDDDDEQLPTDQLEEPTRLRGVIESLLLIADRPLAPARLAQLLGGTVEPSAVRDVLEGWQAELEQSRSGIRLVRVAGGYRLRTDEANAPWIRALTRRRPLRLSRAALETLAIVAYRQPVTRVGIDDVRGVDSSVVLRSLLEKDLLRIVGRRDEPGRPMVYGTTGRFLEVFGLANLSDLPSLREFTELAVGEQESLFGDHALLEDDETTPADAGTSMPSGETIDDGGGDDAA